MLWNDRLEEGLELLNEKALKSLKKFRSSGVGTLTFKITRTRWTLSFPWGICPFPSP